MKLGSSIRRRRKGRREGRKTGGRRGEKGRFSAFLEKVGGRRLLRLALLLAFLGLGAGYLFSTRVLFPAPPPPGDLVRVPDLRGMDLDDAGSLLAERDLALGRVDSLRHPTAVPGEVLGQSPLAGQLHLVGDTVRLAVSTGPEERPVPDVLRLRGDRAATVLEASGFQVVVDSVESTAPRGNVVGLEPEPGTPAVLPREVHLEVSQGPPLLEMPLLLGLQEEQARSILDSLGLVVGDVSTRFRFGRDQGLVVEQEPPAATMIQQGSAVSLVVGRRGR